MWFIRFIIGSLTIRLLYLEIYLLTCFAQPDGWKMTDRFSGFRYELQDLHTSKRLDIQKAIQGTFQNQLGNCV